VIGQEAFREAWQIAGSKTALAEMIGVASSALSMWETRGQVPLKQAILIEQAVGVHRHRLRPDIWPLPFVRVRNQENQKNDPAQL
jgi:DNA-binding transcriptional regulator YdaS (Cro superfamily)